MRGQESTLTEERDKLQGQVEVLRTACMLNSIPLPLGLEDFPPLSTQQAAAGVNEMPATISYQVDESSNPSLHIDWPTFQPSQDPFRRPSQQPENFHVDKQEPTLPDGMSFLLPDPPSPILHARIINLGPKTSPCRPWITPQASHLRHSLLTIQAANRQINPYDASHHRQSRPTQPATALRLKVFAALATPSLKSQASPLPWMTPP